VAKSVSARNAARRLKGGATFIQRSRATSSEEKAIYHNVTGAGKSGVIREFFGASDNDQTVMVGELEQLIQLRLNKAGAA
jgi:hypothetical protein